ncbi:DUF2267 domain-containing protein [Streptomyces globisporus]|uniref:DUF2267 domain-containing protein n=1 Tax=Streptomyces globisporus TaxID=1908 RepID=UPI0004C74BB4|nr:DUF2267 domain-containing protein [Streptomyces globisporus]
MTLQSVTPAATPVPKTRPVSFAELLEQVRYDGAFPTRERAEAAARPVLVALGQQLVGDERVDLAGCLPTEAASLFAAQIPAVAPLSAADFVHVLAREFDGSLATTRWNVEAVLGAVARIAGGELVTRILHQLPSGYALLFGRTCTREWTGP